MSRTTLNALSWAALALAALLWVADPAGAAPPPRGGYRGGPVVHYGGSGGRSGVYVGGYGYHPRAYYGSYARYPYSGGSYVRYAYYGGYTVRYPYYHVYRPWGYGLTLGVYPSYAYYSTPYYGYAYMPQYYYAVPSTYAVVPSSYAEAIPVVPVTTEAPATVDAPARIHLTVPADAAIWFNGHATTPTGRERDFTTPNLTPGKSYSYDMLVRWKAVSGEMKEQKRTVPVHAGEQIRVDFTRPT
jgi:uncharacterized protein (TIGR03000 family)